MGDPIPVGVVALDPVLEAGTKSTLSDCQDLTVTAPGEEPRVVVMIVDRFTQTELDLLRTTHNTPARPSIVLVASELTPGEALHALAAGARGLIRRREADAPHLARAVLGAARGDCVLPPDLLDQLLDHSRADRNAAAPSAWAATALSPRERSVLRMVADGHETSEIARTLAYSQRTVTTVLHDVTQRFRLRNRAHAVAYTLRAGLL